MSGETFSAHVSRPTSYKAWLPIAALYVQCLLLHPRFASSPSARLLRVALLPVVTTLAVTGLTKYRYVPEEDSGPANIQMGVTMVYVILKSVDYATQSGPLLRVRLNEPPANGHSQIPSKDGAQSLDDGPIVVWCLENFMSVRGVGWNWGTPSRYLAPPQNLGRILKRIIIVHGCLVSALGFIVLTRDMGGSPATSLRQIAEWIGVDVRLGPQLLYWLGEYVHTLAFGLCTLCPIDLAFNLFAVLCFIAQSILHSLAPNSVSTFDWRQWTPLYNDPARSQSIADLWGKRWHILFKRVFVISAYNPTVYLAARAGCSLYIQRIAGILATFALSGVMHEVGIRMIADDNYPLIPWTFMFFLFQPLGMIVERLFIHRLPPALRILWVWIFVLTTALKWKQAWMTTVLTHGYPPVAEWWWQRWILPGFNGLPKGIWHGPRR